MLQDFKQGELGKNNKENIGRRNVMFLMSSLVVGGSELKTVRIANNLAAKGWKVTIAYLDAYHELRDEVSCAVDIQYLNRKGKFDIGVLRRIAVYAAQNSIGIICCINLYSLLYGYLSRMLLLPGHVALVATTNATHFDRRWDEYKMWLYAPILRRISRVIFGSRYQMDYWVQRYRLAAEKCMYIYNGVDTDHFQRLSVESQSQFIREKYEIPEHSIVVGSIGRFRSVKRYENVITACVELRTNRGLDAHCLLVGGGFEKSALEELIARIGCGEYVHLVDAVDDVRPYLASMDLFVLSSISETFSNAALEAMAMSLPVVLPRVGGCPEMVEEGVNGFIYEVDDMSQFVDYLYLLGSEKKIRLTMGLAARKYVVDRFHFNSMFDSYVGLLEKSR